MTDWLNKCHFGDCLDTMRRMPDGIAQTCVTSPPYFGLRSYGGGAAEIGKEATPDEFVAKLVDVFREVRRVLKDDGTLFLNLGDSYFAGPAPRATPCGTEGMGVSGSAYRDSTTGALKPKDLIGIPWRVAFALQQPYYTGPVKSEMDRVWLAAMLDAEGSICGTEYESAGRTKTNIYLSITNTSIPIIDKCLRLFPQVARNVYEKTNGTSNRKCYRWDVERMDQKAMFLRTVYPYLVAKRKQAILGYTFIEMQRGLVSKKKGYLPDQHEQRSWLLASLSLLNSGQDVDLPDWVIEPPSLDEPGFYLRQDIIWAKPNPMPESVLDRCTKSHEYLFLLSKSPTYYCDMAAIREESLYTWNSAEKFNKEGQAARHGGIKGNRNGQGDRPSEDQTGRNKRSVWTVATTPYKGAHFATFPTELIEPCILAGAPAGGVVLDPFFGSGTTGQVAQNLGRAFIGCELNTDYAPLQAERLRQMGLILEAA